MTARKLLIKLAKLENLDWPIGWLGEDGDEIEEINDVEVDEENETIVIS